MKKRFSEEQIIVFLREAEAGLPVKELCRRSGFSEASYCLWRSKFGGMRETGSDYVSAHRRDGVNVLADVPIKIYTSRK